MWQPCQSRCRRRAGRAGDSLGNRYATGEKGGRVSFEQIEKVEYPEVRVAWLASPLRARRTIIRILTTIIRTRSGSIHIYISGIIRTRNGIIHFPSGAIRSTLLDHPLTFSIDSVASPVLPTGACVRADRRARDHPRSSTHA